MTLHAVRYSIFFQSRKQIRFNYLIYSKQRTSSFLTGHKCANYCSPAKESTKSGVGTGWRSIVRGCIPLALCLIAVMQWRAYRRRQKSAADWQIWLYRSLPLRTVSRTWGWLAERPVPEPLRSPLFGLYATAFGVNLAEAESAELRDYSSLAEFFARGLRPDARPQDESACLTVPCDGTLLHCGPVHSGRVEQVKGVTYSLQQFLGETPPPIADSNLLYQCILYLAPGDYHRFHSPTEWETQCRRHFAGDLLSVSPRYASWLPGLFCGNERAVYAGRWNYGFFSMAAVGATNVGSVRVYRDPALKTNCAGAQHGFCNEKRLTAQLVRGEPMGEFRMGSTIVLLFEAPRNFRFNVAPGQRVHVGQALGCANKFFVNKNVTEH